MGAEFGINMFFGNFGAVMGVPNPANVSNNVITARMSVHSAQREFIISGHQAQELMLIGSVNILQLLGGI